MTIPYWTPPYCALSQYVMALIHYREARAAVEGGFYVMDKEQEIEWQDKLRALRKEVDQRWWKLANDLDSALYRACGE